MTGRRHLLALTLAALFVGDRARSQDNRTTTQKIKAMAQQELTPALAAEALALHDSLPLGTDALEQYWRTLLLRKLANFAQRSAAPGLPSEIDLRRESLRRAQASGDAALIGQEWIGLGRAARRTGDFDEARQALLEALRIENPYVSWSLAHLHLGGIAMELGDLEGARTSYMAAADAAPQGEGADARPMKGTSAGALGEYYLLVGHLRLARRHFRNERELLGDTHPTVRKRQLERWLFSERFAQVRETAAVWATAARAEGNDELADAIEFIDAIAQSRLDDSDEAIRQFEILTERTRPPIAEAARIRLAALLLDAGRPEDARTRLESAPSARSHSTRERAALLRARLALHDSPGDGFSQATATLESELQDIVNQLLRQWDQVDVPADGLGFLQLAHRRDLISVLLTLQMRRDKSGTAALSTVLKIAQRGAFARRLGLPELDASSLVARLGGRGVSVLWVPANVGSHLFLLANGELHHHPVESERSVRALVRSFRSLVLDPTTNPAQIRRSGHELRATLFPGNAWDLVAQRKELHIIGADAWGRLPIEALPGSSHEFLGQSHAIDHVPSARIAAWIAQARPELQILSTVTSWAPTPSNEATTRWGVQPLTVQEANVEGVYDSWLSRGEIQDLSSLTWRQPAADYHLVLAHGVFAGGRARPSGLAIGDAPHAVWPETIEEGTAAPLTVLLACAADRTPQRRGEDGGSSIASALLWAGAQTVVIADENLELASALAIVREMNAELANGHPVAEALRRARIAVAARAGFEAPAYHSLLKVVGRGDLQVGVAPARTGIGWLWWTIGLALILPAMLLAARHARRRAA